MKKIITAASLLALFSCAKAQTEKQDWMVGGQLRLNTSNHNTEIAFEPSGGIFISSSRAVRGNCMLGYSKTGETKVTNFGIGPFLRYYFTDANVRQILDGSFDYLSQKVRDPGSSSTNSGLSVFLGR